MGDLPKPRQRQTTRNKPPEGQSPEILQPAAESQKDINLRLTGDKLKRELDEVSRPYWQQVLRNPQSLTALITSVGAIFAVYLLINEKYFAIREERYQLQDKRYELQDKLNQLQIVQTQLLKTQADDQKAVADAEKAAAIEEIAKANDAKKKAADDIAAAEKRVAFSKAHAEHATEYAESVDLALKAEMAITVLRTTRMNSHRLSMTNVESTRSQAIQAWRRAPTPQARAAVADAYSLPTAVLGKNSYDSPTLDGNLAYMAAYSLDGARILTAENASIRLWDANGKYLKQLEFRSNTSKTQPIGSTSAQFSPDGKLVVGEDYDSPGGPTVRVWDVDSGAILSSTPKAGSLPTFSPDSSRVASVDPDGTIEVWNAKVMSPPIQVRGSTKSSNNGVWLNALKFSPDKEANLIAAIGADTIARVWDARTGVQRWPTKGQLSPNTGSHSTLAFSSDGKRLVSAGGFDVPAVVLDILDGNRICTINSGNIGDKGWFKTAVFSPEKESSLVLTAGWESTTEIWDANCQPLRSFVGSNSSQGATFSRDGKRALTIGDDGIVRVWDTQTGRQSAELQGICPVLSEDSESETLRADFSPDGKHVLITAGGCPASVYTIVPEAKVGEFLKK